MSEDRPITGELRRAMVEGNYHFDGHHIVREELAIGRERFYGLCDAIDAVHASLEAENAGLRERLAELDKRDDCMHDGWVELPKDANGEHIHVGDVVIESLPFGGESKPLVVDRMELCKYDGEDVWAVALDTNEASWAQPPLLRHYHAPTVEDVLREMHAELDEVTALYVGEVIGSDERDHDEARIFAEYAKRLTLAGDAE